MRARPAVHRSFQPRPVWGIRSHPCPTAAALVTVLLALAACGGGGGGDVGDGGGDGDGLIIGSGGGRAASEVETEQLLRSASTRASAALGVNLENLQRFDDGSTTDGGDPLMTLDEGSEGFLVRTLGIDDANARVERKGDLITIDPDDTRLCADDESVSFDDDLADLYGDIPDGAFDDDGMSDCLRLVTDLRVQVEAFTEDSGIVSYLFDGAPVLRIGYSPDGGVYELLLEGFQRVLQRVASFEIGTDSALDVPSTMRGTLRLSGRVSDATEGRETAELELDVIEAIEIADDDGVDAFTLAPSRVFRVSSDAAAGTATMSVEWAALRLVAEDDEEVGGPVTTLNLGGLGFELDAREGSDALTLRNVGVGDVPLNIEIDSVTSLSVALETFGVSLDGASGALTFDTPFGVDVMIDNLMELIEELPPEYQATFEAMAPAGTRLVEQPNGATRVDAGGPFTASFVASDANGSVQSEVSAGVGACFGAGEDVDSELELENLSCE